MKTVLVTGATRGLGLAIARRLLEDGYRVAASGRSPGAEFEELQRRHDDRLGFFPFDLAEIDGIHGFAKRVMDSFGTPWGLVNNAALGTDGVLGTMHNADIERLLRINTLAPIVLTKYVSRAMLVRREGRIVNIASIIAATGYSGLTAYAASKAAMLGFTRSLAREIGRAGITVNAVAPGFVETDMTEGLDSAKLASIAKRSALRRLVDPSDVAGAVCYLLGESAGAITGTTITVDAGNTA